jgi:hypothetical protein
VGYVAARVNPKDMEPAEPSSLNEHSTCLITLLQQKTSTGALRRHLFRDVVVAEDGPPGASPAVKANGAPAG